MIFIGSFLVLMGWDIIHDVDLWSGEWWGRLFVVLGAMVLVQSLTKADKG